MKKKNKKQQSTNIKIETSTTSKYLGQKKSVKKILKGHSSASAKRYTKVIKEISHIVRSSDTGKFISGLHYSSDKPTEFKGSRLEKVKNHAVRSSPTIKEGTRIGGPKRK